MKIDCISDLHGHYPKLEGGDLLIVAGDLTARNHPSDVIDWKNWFLDVSKLYKKSILIAGNHDNWIQERILLNDDKSNWETEDISYLEDSATEFEGLKIWGSPWTKRFEGMNPRCMAFTVDTDEELAEKWAMIPDDVDILVTHSPPYGMCDYREFTKQEKIKNICAGYGSKSLEKRINDIDVNGDGKRRLLICGHIHEGYGVLNISSMIHDKCTWKIINASYVNERYEPVNKPIRIEL